ncbi:MAG: GlpM family protein [Planctomycetota bacterium]
MDWMLKAALGAGVVILVQLLARTRSYYIAGLVPLFPTFTLIAHYLVGTQRTGPELRETIVFGMLSLGPYLLYLGSLYVLVGWFRLVPSLIGATVVWLAAAAALIALWSRT